MCEVRNYNYLRGGTNSSRSYFLVTVIAVLCSFCLKSHSWFIMDGSPPTCLSTSVLPSFSIRYWRNARLTIFNGLSSGFMIRGSVSVNGIITDSPALLSNRWSANRKSARKRLFCFKGFHAIYVLRRNNIRVVFLFRLSHISAHACMHAKTHGVGLAQDACFEAREIRIRSPISLRDTFTVNSESCGRQDLRIFTN